jgi:hypothetical protein
MRRRHQGRVVSTANPISCSSACKSSFTRSAKQSFKHEIRHTTSKLNSLVCVANQADRDFASAPVDRNSLVGVRERIGELGTEPPMADAEIIREMARRAAQANFY